MANASVIDPFISDEEEVDLDDEISAAIELGIRAADEGRLVSSDKVRELIPLWITKFSTPSQR
jgi:predicted transcriptional regulator